MLDLSRVRIIDTEAGGLDSTRHPLLEVAYAGMEGPVTLLWNKEAEIERCSANALRINQFCERKPQGEALSAMELASRLSVDLFQCTLVAANPHFDADFVEAHLRRNGKLTRGQQPNWDFRLVDIKSLALGWLAARGQLSISPSWHQADLSRLMGVPVPDRESSHSAQGDVIWTRLMLRIILGLDPAPLL